MQPGETRMAALGDPLPEKSSPTLPGGDILALAGWPAGFPGYTALTISQGHRVELSWDMNPYLSSCKEGQV